jgi:PAS domain S-box-containing protein
MIDVSATKQKASISNGLDIDIFDNLPIAVYTCDKSGYITSYNKAAVKLWGRVPNIGNDLWCGSWRIFQPDGSPLPLDLCPMARTLKEGIAIEGEEIIVQRPDGSKRNVLPYPAPIFDSSGTLTGAINSLIDITWQKEDENKQAMFAAIVDSSEDAIISKTLDGVITSWNRASEKLYGYTEEEILGKPITILIPHERGQEEEHIIDKIRHGENVDHFETIRIAKTGKLIPISLTVSPIRNNKGQIIGASKIARDISKQKLAEERLQRYAENLEILNSVGRIVSKSLDIQDILQNVTDATTRLTGAAFGAFVYNQVDKQGESYKLYTSSGTPREAFEKFDMLSNTSIFNSTFNGEGTVRIDDITKDPRYGKISPHFGMSEGQLSVVSYLAVPVISKSGAVIGGLFYGHPNPGKFTEEHEKLISSVVVQAAVALDNAKLYEEIKVLNAKKDEFIGLASHELKTPVTSINGYLQIIERNLPRGDSNKPFISKARQQVSKLANLISDLLDVSKIQTGQLPFSYANFDMLKLLEEVTEVMRQTNTSHRIELHCDADQLMINADQQRIEQVIINLISNAVKYSPNSKQVILKASISGDQLRVSVQDFGIGIEKDQQECIFSRFYRVQSVADHMSGLGIGLYISNEIINRHQGKLWVQSSPGEGSTFFFEIPVTKPGS